MNTQAPEQRIEFLRESQGPCLQSHAPIDVVVIMLGTNDLKAFFRVSAAEIASGAGALVGIVQTSRAGPGGGVPLVLLIAPPPFVADRGHPELWGFAHPEAESRRFPRMFAAVAEESRCELLDAASVVTPSPLDGVHIDAGGHRQLGCAVADASS